MVVANPSVTVVYLCIAAQAERIGVQLVFGEKGEEALMGAAAFTRGSEAAVLLIQIAVATATSEPERHSRAGHHVVVYLRTLIAHNTHTPFHLLTRPFEPLPSGLLSIAVTKAATE